VTPRMNESRDCRFRNAISALLYAGDSKRNLVCWRWKRLCKKEKIL
jgi:hypothetical protein